MTPIWWSAATRDELRAALPEALVVVPVGATEQHGPHLPAGTDALIVETVVARAVAAAAPTCPRPLLVAPTVGIGASDHHLPWSGTLSLSPGTLLAVLLDLARSVADCGGRRIVLVNGHGGNHGVCVAAAAAAAARHAVTVACADYWTLWRPDGVPQDWPGHAGRSETALVLAIRPDLVRPVEPRDPVPEAPAVPGFAVHSGRLWSAIDGYTDDPAAGTAADGARWLDALTAALADRLTALAKVG